MVELEVKICDFKRLLPCFLTLNSSVLRRTPHELEVTNWYLKLDWLAGISVSLRMIGSLGSENLSLSVRSGSEWCRKTGWGNCKALV
jgi:hypothetical protein